MNYRVDLPNLFERFGRQLDIYSGNTVYYRLVPRSAPPVPAVGQELEEHYLESFRVVGFCRYDGTDYAAVLYDKSEDRKKIGRIGYIRASDFLSGDIYDRRAAAVLALQGKAELKSPFIRCKIEIEE